MLRIDRRTLTLWTLALLAGSTAHAQEWRRLVPSCYSFSPAASCQDTRRDRTVLFVGHGATGPWSDTWEYDGQRWREVVTGRHPSPRAGAAIAFDPARGRVVMFGGDPPSGASSTLQDTWEFDGVSWTPVTTATTPLARREQAMAYEPQRGIVMHGGYGLNGTLGDTWAFNGVDWTLIAAGLPRQSAAMAYDQARGQLLLFGGYTGAAYPRELLRLQGSSWQVVSSIGPAGRMGHGMAYDSVSQITVVFGGRTGGTSVAPETWGWTSSGWFLLSSTGPPASFGPSCSYDPRRARTVLVEPDSGLQTWSLDLATVHWTREQFTPATNVTSSLAYDWNRDVAVIGGNGPETWEWSGGSWRVRTTATPAPRRSYPGFCFDLRNGRTVLFGGWDNNFGNTNETWVYDGIDWRNANPPVSPPPQRGMAMCGSPTGVIMLGVTGDTWEFDGVTWTQRLVAGPPARIEAGMTFDLARNRAVLFGGLVGAVPSNETWEWDGLQWRAANTPHRPAPRYGVGVAFDLARQRVVISGGGSYNGQFFDLANDTWEYDGFDWTPVAVAHASPGQLRHGMTGDLRGRIITFGGWFGAETWELRQRVVVPQPIGAGCAGSNGTPALTSLDGMPAVLGSTFALAIDSLPTAPGVAALVLGYDLQQWNGAPLPVDLTPLGLAGCSAFVSVDDVRLLAHGGGHARWTIDLPATPQLFGLVAGAQALAFDTAAPSGVGSVSNGLRIELR